MQAEFKAWNARVGALGIVYTQTEFEDSLFAIAKGFMDGRDLALTPFRPYYKYCGTYQSWRMFVAPHTFPERLHLEIRESGEWRSVYIERDPRHTWLGEKLDHDRMRSAIFRYGWRTYRTSFGQFMDWVAVQARRDYPAATAVRGRYWKQRSPTPEEARRGFEPEGSWDDTISRELTR